ncbi:MAG: phosphomannomutase/phosphoglucomutase [Candidatus Anstonellales archaeon]
MLNESIFREYDLRGIIGKDIDENGFNTIALAFANILKKRKLKTCLIGHDYREKSELFRQYFVKGLIDNGINVIDIGMSLTPILHHAQFFYKCKACAAITASHNPKEWTGLKLSYDIKRTFLPDDIKELKKEVEIVNKRMKGQGKSKNTKSLGNYKRGHYFHIYTEDLKRIIGEIKQAKKIKAVVNPGNGTACAFAGPLLRAFNIKTYEINNNLDWTFPKYYPNPSLEEMMKETANKTKQEKADIGFAFDGDGDRLGVVDEKGNIIYADYYIAALLDYIASKLPEEEKRKRAVIYNVATSKVIADIAKKHGIKAVMCKTGHSYIRDEMQKRNAILAGESSGHVFINRPFYYGFDDACYAALLIVKMITEKGRLSKCIEKLPKYITSPTYQIFCPDKEKYRKIEEITNLLIKNGLNPITINGARVEFEDAWFVIRASSNMPSIVVRIEARKEKRLEEIKEFVKLILNKVGINSAWKTG